MPRRMSKEKEREYSELQAYLDYYFTHVLGLDPTSPIHPTNVGRQIVDQFGRSKALQGLKQAVNDTIRDLDEQPLEFVQRLDSALRERGIVTVSEFRRRYGSSYRRILKRGRIKTETEYYLVAGVLADQPSTLDEAEKAVLEELVSTYGQIA